MSLYGPEVVPDAVVAFANFAFGSWEHCMEQPGDCDAEVLAEKLFQELQKRLLLVEERPTPTRFWTFTACVRSLLFAKLFGIPPEQWAVSRTKPKEEQAKRIQRVMAFFRAADAPAALRIACLCMRLTDHCMCLSAKTPKPKDDPILVQLARGSIMKEAGSTFAEILPHLGADPVLPVPQALVALLATLGKLAARLAVYKGYPNRLRCTTRRSILMPALRLCTKTSRI